MIKRLVRTLNIPVQVGGGIRSSKLPLHLSKQVFRGWSGNRRGGQPHFSLVLGEPFRGDKIAVSMRCARQSRGGRLKLIVIVPDGPEQDSIAIAPRWK